MNYILLIILSIILIIFFFYNKKTLENITADKDINSVNIVISRYNEDVTWVNETPFSKYPVFLYNKGINSNYGKVQNLKHYEELINVGRESHTYLYHIINNYDNLSDITLFLPGSANSTVYNKWQRTKLLMNKIENNKNNSSIIIGEYYKNSISSELYNFKLHDYQSTTIENKNSNSIKLEPARIRPFGKWYVNKFNDIKTYYLPYSGIIAISKNDIKQKSKKYYESLLQELSYSSNPEVGHYFERSWEAIFYPLNNPIYVNAGDI
jgi:hypothetical protein